MEGVRGIIEAVRELEQASAQGDFVPALSGDELNLIAQALDESEAGRLASHVLSLWPTLTSPQRTAALLLVANVLARHR
jgi:hypothetical protein